MALVFAMDSSSATDRRLVATYEDLLTVTGIMHTLLTDDRRDSDEIEGYFVLADRQRDLISVLTSTSAIGLAGFIAKAQGALLRPIERGYDGAMQISISLCEDIVRSARMN